MALRAGYYGIKCGLKAKLAEIAGSWDETVNSIFPRDEQAVLGAVNELTYPYKDTTKTTEEVTYTDEGSGIIVANSNGATGNALFQIKSSNVPYAIDHDVYLSGCPSGGSSTTHEIYLWDETISKGYNCYGEPVLIPASTYGHNVNINIRIRAGQTANNMIFKPMLSMSPLTPYTPFAMTNKELTEVAGVVSNLDMSKGISSSGEYTDLNDVKKSGIYAVFGSALNKPSDISTIINGTLIVTHKTSLDDVTQTLINGNEGTIYVRTYATATGWSSWYKFTGTIVS